jgi:hypothetical protein
VQLFANSQVILSLLERAKIAVQTSGVQAVTPSAAPVFLIRDVASEVGEVHPRNAKIPVPEMPRLHISHRYLIA